MVQKMMFNDVLMDSVFPGLIDENKNNEKVRFNPEKAVQLLAEAGWKDRNSRGQLIKNGAPLTIEAPRALLEGILKVYYTIYQEDLRKPASR